MIDFLTVIFLGVAAKTVYARGCTALTELKADAAEYVYASGCRKDLRIITPKGCKIVR